MNKTYVLAVGLLALTISQEISAKPSPYDVMTQCTYLEMDIDELARSPIGSSNEECKQELLKSERPLEIAAEKLLYDKFEESYQGVVESESHLLKIKDSWFKCSKLKWQLDSYLRRYELIKKDIKSL